MKRVSIEFDDNDLELIYVIIRVFATILGIKGNVSIIDKKQWIELFEDVSTKKKKNEVENELDYVYGQCQPTSKIMYVNARLCKREWNVLISTILHEMLHMRFPSKSEAVISSLERELMGRYDSIRRCDKGVVGWQTVLKQ